MAEFNRCELTDLAKTCILHTLSVLRGANESCPIEHVNIFCKALYQAVRQQKNKRWLKLSEKSLELDPQHVRQYCTGERCTEKFFLEIEEEISKCAAEDFDQESFFRACWDAYHEHEQPDMIVTEFSNGPLRECVYQLWLIFNATMPSGSSRMVMPARNLDMIVRRVCDMCRHECWREDLDYGTTAENSYLDFSEYIKVFARYHEKFKLNPALMCEVIQELREEVVDAILKKGFLTKEGLRVKSWKRRWFVLWKTVLRYYECREKPVLKGQVVLNATTKVIELADGSKKKPHCFEVVCGRTGRHYAISADDKRSRHGWILAIEKAIDLAKILVGNEPSRKISIPESNPQLAANFYFTVFEKWHSIIPKWEGAVKKVVPVSEENMSEDEGEQTFRRRSKTLMSESDASARQPVMRSRQMSIPESGRRNRSNSDPSSVATSSSTILSELTESAQHDKNRNSDFIKENFFMGSSFVVEPEEPTPSSIHHTPIREDYLGVQPVQLRKSSSERVLTKSNDMMETSCTESDLESDLGPAGEFRARCRATPSKGNKQPALS